jgi:hypothetical protein
MALAALDLRMWYSKGGLPIVHSGSVGDLRMRTIAPLRRGFFLPTKRRAPVLETGEGERPPRERQASADLSEGCVRFRIRHGRSARFCRTNFAARRCMLGLSGPLGRDEVSCPGAGKPTSFPAERWNRSQSMRIGLMFRTTSLALGMVAKFIPESKTDPAQRPPRYWGPLLLPRQNAPL